MNITPEAINQNARNKGFYCAIDELMAHPDLTMKQKDFIRYLWRMNRLMLIVTELAEAAEGIRKNKFGYEPASGGMMEELADAEIRLRDFVADENSDLEHAVAIKHYYNMNREYLHGKVG